MRTEKEVQDKIAEVSDKRFLTTEDRRETFLIALRWVLEEAPS